MVNRKHRKKSKFFRQTINKLNHKLNYDFFQQRKQGFQIEGDMKSALDLIRRQTQKISQPSKSRKTSIRRNTLDYRKRKSSIRKSKKLAILPELLQLIHHHSAQNNELIKFKRRKILHLLILGINRRNADKLCDALQIILLASSYLNLEQQEMSLKAICCNLITKFYRILQKKRKEERLQYSKKRRSVVLNNIIGKDNFTQNFALKFRKTQLIKQSSFSVEKRKNEKKTKINEKYFIQLPEPSTIFEHQSNYDFAIITVDYKNCLFPYEYPKTISNYLNKQQYRHMISKLNGILFPQRQCYEWNSIFRLYFMDIFFMFLCFILYSLMHLIGVDQNTSTIFLIVILIIFIAISAHIILGEQSFKNQIQTNEKIQQHIQNLKEQYASKEIQFRVSKGNDALFIAIPAAEEETSSEKGSLSEISEKNDLEQSYQIPQIPEIIREDCERKNILNNLGRDDSLNSDSSLSEMDSEFYVPQIFQNNSFKQDSL